MKEIIIEVADDFGKTLKPEKMNCEIKGELVRCKDCKFWHRELPKITDGDGKEYCICNLTGSYHNPSDWFCAEGIRR